jgi:adenylate cyclase
MPSFINLSIICNINPNWYLSAPAFAIYLILFLLVLWVFYEYIRLRFARKLFHLERIINKRSEELILEKEKTEALLGNLLPRTTADEIITKGKAAKIKYNFVTVLFSDIQGFTQIAEEMNPEVLIDELDKFFFHFDSVVEKYGIEKIKTIGDAYMCAGGLPDKNRTNPVEVILAALEMQQYMQKLRESSIIQGMKYWDIRIGIHTGTVIAGVVGQKKLSYDIWGDTVNTASRMESSGEAGKVNISGTTYEFVKDFFVCHHRGKMPVKYKGELDMYFVEAILPGLCDDNGNPNEHFRLKMQLIRIQDVEETVGKYFSDEAPPDLYFHNAQYAKNISAQVDLIANAERIPEELYVEVKLAAIFLISGFISDYHNPVEAAHSLMDKILKNFGFEENNINAAKKTISNSFSAKIESQADTIIHDARYDYLGREDYLNLSERLLRERNEHGMITTGKEWFEIQKDLLVSNDFITDTARMLRTVSIQEQIKVLEPFNN